MQQGIHAPAWVGALGQPLGVAKSCGPAGSRCPGLLQDRVEARQGTFAICMLLPLQVPQLMDMVVSRLEPVASLTFSGRVIIFPE